MAETYKQFLASPTASAALLADDASLHYVATTTTFAGSTEIIKHLTALQRQVRKKQEDVINTIEGQDSVVVEVATALEFLTSGGVYLPGLDDNFVSDRVVYVPIIHIVSLDENKKISQIRLHWDQGALLKQLDVFSKTGRNWPIKDSRDQLKLIQTSLKIVGEPVEETSSYNETIVHARSKSTNVLRDPYATLQLFGNREEMAAADAAAFTNPTPYAGSRPRQRGFTEILGDVPANESAKAAPAPYAGSRPHQREFTEILGDNPVDQSTDAPFHRPASPTKIGQGKNHPEMRILNNHDDIDVQGTNIIQQDRLMRPHPGKYNHFEFADGSDPRDAPQRGVDMDKQPKSKHDSTWSFNDFVTPHKNQATKGMRSEDLRNWDTQTAREEEAQKQLPLGKGRRDAETHFELQDDGERLAGDEDRPSKLRGAGHNEGLGLYKNQIFDKHAPTPGQERALGNITNLKDRGKDFDAHFTMTDNSPSGPKSTDVMHENRKKVVKMMDHNWEVYEQSPLKENKPQNPVAKNADGTGIHIAGDGMGSKKGTSRNWLYGEDDEAAKPTPRANAQPSGGKKSFWDF